MWGGQAAEFLIGLVCQVKKCGKILQLVKAKIWSIPNAWDRLPKKHKHEPKFRIASINCEDIPKPIQKEWVLMKSIDWNKSQYTVKYSKQQQKAKTFLAL